MNNSRSFDESATYHIKVKGILEPSWSDWFDGLTIEVDGCDQSVLAGVVADQAALHGMLAKLRDLGLPILLVERKELTYE